MSNPPGWVKQSRIQSSYTEMDFMPSISAGVVAAGDINSQPVQTGALSPGGPAFWSYLWFGFATVYLVGVYYGMIKLHSS